MAYEPPPLSQYRSSLTHVVGSYAEMTADEKRLADKIIDVLGERNLSDEKANHVTRAIFWSAVFRNGWDTSEPNEHPGSLPGRRFTDASSCIGTFNQDLPPSREALRKAAKDNAPIPRAAPHRRQGSSAYLKPSINWDTEGIVWMYVDGKGQAVNAKYISLRAGWIHSQARARAIIHWDECECARIGRWNYLLAVYFARNRLLRWMRDNPRDQGVGNPNNADQRRPTADIPNEETLEDLVPIRTGSAILAQYADVARDINSMTGGQIVGIYKISKGL